MVLGGVGVFLLFAAVGASLFGTGTETASSSAHRSLAQRLSTSTWALAVPTGWLATPLGQIEDGDSVDLLGVRVSDRPLAMAVAADLRVMSVDDRAITFEVDEESATAIASARAGGFLIVPLLRSTR